MEPGQEAFHPEKSVKEAMGIMHGSSPQQREYREVTIRIGGDQHVKVIAMVKTVSGRVPADITVRLRKITVTGAIGNPHFFTVTDTVFAFLCRSNKRRAITGKSQVIRVNEPLINRSLKELFVINVKKRAIRLVINGKRDLFKISKQLFYGDLI